MNDKLEFDRLVSLGDQRVGEKEDPVLASIIIQAYTPKRDPAPKPVQYLKGSVLEDVIVPIAQNYRQKISTDGVIIPTVNDPISLLFMVHRKK